MQARQAKPNQDGLHPRRSTAEPGSWRRCGDGATMRVDAKGNELIVI
jgi:hypothetical protein